MALYSLEPGNISFQHLTCFWNSAFSPAPTSPLTPTAEVKGHQDSITWLWEGLYVTSTTSRRAGTQTSFCAACSSPSTASCHGDKGNACRCLIVTETRVTQMMGRIKEDLQPALQLQQEGSESCSALRSGQRVEKTEEVQEPKSGLRGGPRPTPYDFAWMDA